MEHYSFKAAWKKAHQLNEYRNLEVDVLNAVITKSHCNIILKLIKDIKARILIYLFSIVTILGLMIYAFIFLKIQLSMAIGIPFLIVGLFLLFKLISEIVRFKILSNRNDELLIQEANIESSKKLKRIMRVDFLIVLSVFYLVGTLSILAYLFNFNELRSWSQSINLSEVLIIFVLLLFLIPWSIRTTINQKYSALNQKLKKSIDYYNGDYTK